MIRTISYRDLTADQRSKGAQKNRQRLLGFLSNPFLTGDQRQAVYDKIAFIGKWEKLQLDIPAVKQAPPPVHQAAAPLLAASPEHHHHVQPLPPAPPPRVPEHHVVNVKDVVDTKEKVS